MSYDRTESSIAIKVPPDENKKNHGTYKVKAELTFQHGAFESLEEIVIVVYAREEVVIQEHKVDTSKAPDTVRIVSEYGNIGKDGVIFEKMDKQYDDYPAYEAKDKSPPLYLFHDRTVGRWFVSFQLGGKKPLNACQSDEVDPSKLTDWLGSDGITKIEKIGTTSDTTATAATSVLGQSGTRKQPRVSRQSPNDAKCMSLVNRIHRLENTEQIMRDKADAEFPPNVHSVAVAGSKCGEEEGREQNEDCTKFTKWKSVAHLMWDLPPKTESASLGVSRSPEGPQWPLGAEH